MSPTRRTRRMRSSPGGFTLAEILIAMVIVAIIGAATGRLLLNENRFFDQQTNLKTARRVARSSMTILLSDLRMVQDSGGVDSVTADGKLIRIRVPYEFGLVCGTNLTTTTVSMLPVDSALTAMSGYAGFAWRDTVTGSGRYTYLTPGVLSTAPAPAASPSTCTGNGAGQAQIRTVSMNGRSGNLYDLSSTAPSGAPVGAAVFFWQRVTYSFGSSGIYSGKIGLFRNVQGGANEEIMAPFDTSARFRFYQAGDDTSEVAAPAVGNIVGIDVVLNALSPNAVSNNPTNSPGKIVTSVFFNNVRAY